MYIYVYMYTYTYVRITGGSRIQEPLFMLTSRGPLKFQISQGLGPILPDRFFESCFCEDARPTCTRGADHDARASATCRKLAAVLSTDRLTLLCKGNLGVPKEGGLNIGQHEGLNHVNN